MATKAELTEALEAAQALLLDIQHQKYHDPDSDHHEYCAGCGQSPYGGIYHRDECLVPRVNDVLIKVGNTLNNLTEAEATFRLVLRRRKEKKRREEIRRKKEEERGRENHERAEYKRLKAKYEGGKP